MSTISIIGNEKLGATLKLQNNQQHVDITANDVNQVQWFRDGQLIDGATGVNYTITNADLSADLSAQVSYKNATTSVLSDQRAIDTPITDSLLLKNATQGLQYDLDVWQTMATPSSSLQAPIGRYYADTQNLVTLDADQNGSIVYVDNTTKSVWLQDLNTGVTNYPGTGLTAQLHEMTYPVGLETPAARIAAGFRVVSTEMDSNRDGISETLSVANIQDANTQAIKTQLFIDQQLITIDNETNSLTANGGYEVKAVADVDGNGTSDIVLFNAAHHSVEVLQMNGTTVSARTTLATLPAGFEINSVGDISGDGKADILLRDGLGNLQSLEMHLDQANQLTATTSPVDTSVTGVSTMASEYQIIARPDFNLDGKADLLLQNPNNGTSYACLMDGNKISAANIIENFADWNVKSVSTDAMTGKIDLILQQVGTDTLAVVPMNGVNGTELNLPQAQVANYGNEWQIDQADQVSPLGLTGVIPTSWLGLL